MQRHPNPDEFKAYINANSISQPAPNCGPQPVSHCGPQPVSHCGPQPSHRGPQPVLHCGPQPAAGSRTLKNSLLDMLERRIGTLVHFSKTSDTILEQLQAADSMIARRSEWTQARKEQFQNIQNECELAKCMASDVIQALLQQELPEPPAKFEGNQLLKTLETILIPGESGEKKAKKEGESIDPPAYPISTDTDRLVDEVKQLQEETTKLKAQLSRVTKERDESRDSAQKLENQKKGADQGLKEEKLKIAARDRNLKERDEQIKVLQDDVKAMAALHIEEATRLQAQLSCVTKERDESRDSAKKLEKEKKEAEEMLEENKKLLKMLEENKEAEEEEKLKVLDDGGKEEVPQLSYLTDDDDGTTQPLNHSSPDQPHRDEELYHRSIISSALQSSKSCHEDVDFDNDGEEEKDRLCIPLRWNKKKKEKKKREGPKKPSNAFMYFVQEERANVKKDNPEATFGEIGKILGQRWKELTASDKRPFEEKNKKDRERYQKEVEEGGALEQPAKKQKGKKEEEEDGHEEQAGDDSGNDLKKDVIALLKEHDFVQIMTKKMLRTRVEEKRGLEADALKDKKDEISRIVDEYIAQ